MANSEMQGGVPIDADSAEELRREIGMLSAKLDRLDGKANGRHEATWAACQRLSGRVTALEAAPPGNGSGELPERVTLAEGRIEGVAEMAKKRLDGHDASIAELAERVGDIAVGPLAGPGEAKKLGDRLDGQRFAIGVQTERIDNLQAQVNELNRKRKVDARAFGKLNGRVDELEHERGVLHQRLDADTKRLDGLDRAVAAVIYARGACIPDEVLAEKTGVVEWAEPGKPETFAEHIDRLRQAIALLKEWDGNGRFGSSFAEWNARRKRFLDAGDA